MELEGGVRMGKHAKLPHTEKHADGQWVPSKNTRGNSYEHLVKTRYEINNRKVKLAVATYGSSPRPQEASSPECTAEHTIVNCKSGNFCC